MKIVKENNSGITPKAGCVCAEGWQSTRGLWQPLFGCNCNCDGYGTDTSSANKNLASNA